MRWSMLLSLMTASPLFCASHVYAPLASSFINTINTSNGHQTIAGLAGLYAQNFFLAPDAKTFFVMSSSGALKAIQPSTGKTLAYKTTYPVYYNIDNIYNAYKPAFALTPDGSKLLVGTCGLAPNGCIEGFVEIFDTASAQELATISFNADQVNSIAVTPDGQTAYVSQGNSITAISLSTLTVGNSLVLVAPGQLGALGELVLNSSGTLAYIAAAGFVGSLWEVNLPELTLAAQIGLSTAARIAISPDGSALCALTTTTSIFAGNDTLTCYQAPSLSAIGSVPLPANSSAGPLIDTTGKFAYVASPTTGLTYQVDISSVSIPAAFPSGDPLDLAMSASGTLYCLSGAGASVAVFGKTSSIPSYAISTPPATQLAVAPNGLQIYLSPSAPGGDGILNPRNGVVLVSLLTGGTLATYLPATSVSLMALSPDGTTLFAAGGTPFNDSLNFFVVDTSSGTIKNQIASSFFAATLAMSPNGKTVLFGNSNYQIGVYDVGTGTVVGTIPLRGGAGAAINPAGTLAYIGDSSNTSSISVVDLTSYSVIGSITAGSQSIVFSPTAPVAYSWSGNDQSGTLYAIDTLTNTVISTMPLQPGYSLTISPDGKYLYAAGTIQYSTNYFPGSIVDTATMMIVGETPTLSPLVAH